MKPGALRTMSRKRLTGLLAAAAAAVGFVLAPPGRADEPGHDEREGNVFFQRPDRATKRRIDELIGRFAEDSVRARTAAGRELEDIGYWAVDPLMTALATKEPPIRAAAALTLAATMDARGLPALREAVERETSHPFVAGFACIGLARHRDTSAIDPLRKALRSSKSIHTLRAAAPLMLARLGTPEALTLLRERVRGGNGSFRARAARLLALGFFPQAALEPDRPVPSAALREGLRSRRRELRRASIVAFLVATLRRADTRDALIALLDRETAPEVLLPGLVGLSRFEDTATTVYLAHRAARPGDDDVRARSCDLLAPRADVSALDDLLAILRRSNPARLRASAVIALGGIDHPDASAAVLDKLGDKSKLVRAAAAVASVRLPQEAARREAQARISARLRRGEPSRAVRPDMSEAWAVLAGEKTTGAWREIGEERLFRELFRPYQKRLLREVNLAAEDALDLTRITNLQTDTEILAGADVSSPGGGGDGDTGGAGAGDGDTGDGDAGDGDAGDRGGGGESGDVGAGDGSGDATPSSGSPTLPDDQPAVSKPAGAKAPAVGSPRTNAWQELRDLKVDLVRRPLFGPEDLPAAATTR